MNAVDLLNCSEQLDAVATNFANMPGDAKAVEAALHCRMAQSYVLELAYHLAEGMEPFDAAEATAKGTLDVSPSVAIVLKILKAKPTQ